ncbi:MAG: phage tail tape measure protein [Isosphaeraceae bacterium]|nr:phage tail tape measure protein [Isosphaeraceae bacterium]
MLNLKIAEAFVDVSAQMSKYNQAIAKIQSDLAKLPGSVVINLAVQNSAVVQGIRAVTEASRQSMREQKQFDNELQQHVRVMLKEHVTSKREAAQTAARDQKQFDTELQQQFRTNLKQHATDKRVATKAETDAARQSAREQKQFDSELQQQLRANLRQALADKRAAAQTAAAVVRQGILQQRQWDAELEQQFRATLRQRVADKRAAAKAETDASRQAMREQKQFDSELQQQFQATLRQHAANQRAMAAWQASTRINLNGPLPSRRGWRGGGGGYGMGRGGSFVSGLAMGSGMGYTSNPYMAAGVALAQLASAAAASTIALETQYAVLRRISGFSAAQTGQVKQALFGLGTSQGNAASVEDLGNMATIGARMGVSDKGGVKGLVEFTEGMSKLATVIQDMDAEKLADEVGRSLNNFQLGTEYVQGFGSALMALDNVSIASASDILNITQRLGGIGHAVGLSIQQTMALASVLKDVGISNEVAGTSFSQIFQKMATGSEKFAKEIGMDARKFEDAYRKGPIDALGLVIEHLARMDDTVEKMQALDNLGLKGARVSGSLLRLTSVWDRLAGRIKLADKEMVNGKALAEGVAIQAATTESAITRMKNGFREFGDAIMSKVNPALGGTADALGDIAAGLAMVVRGERNDWKALGVNPQAGKPLPKPPEPAPPQKLPNDVTTEQMQAEYTASGQAIREAQLARDEARKRAAAAEDARRAAFDKAGQREGVPVAAWQKDLVAAEAKAEEAKLKAAKAGEEVEKRIAEQRALGERLVRRQNENALENLRERAKNAIINGFAAQQQFGNGMLGVGVGALRAAWGGVAAPPAAQRQLGNPNPEVAKIKAEMATVDAELAKAKRIAAARDQEMVLVAWQVGLDKNNPKNKARLDAAIQKSIKAEGEVNRLDERKKKVQDRLDAAPKNLPPDPTKSRPQHYAVTMNSAFESGTRVLEAALNQKGDEEAREAQKRIAENTESAETLLGKAVALLTDIKDKMGKAVVN